MLIHFYGHRVVLGSNEHSGHRVTGEKISHIQILVVIMYEHLGHRVTGENISHLQILVVIMWYMILTNTWAIALRVRIFIISRSWWSSCILNLVLLCHMFL